MPTETTLSYIRPHFFIIGERKCGTSSLYRYILDHPQVLPGARKEMQFFSQGEKQVAANFKHYLSEFPPLTSDENSPLAWPELNDEGILYHESLTFARTGDVSYVTGEASADTFCDVEPRLLQKYLPNLRLILLLRDPVARAFSHHRMFGRFQEEGRELGFHVGDFSSDMRQELQAISRGNKGPSLSPGIYIDNIKAWVDCWGRDRILVLFSEDLTHADTAAGSMAAITDHLMLPAHDFSGVLSKQFNKAPPADVPTEIAAELRAFYHPHCEALARYLGLPLPWLADIASQGGKA